MTQTDQTPKPEHNRFPSQARYILGNEAAERYSYYGMKGILALYITNVLIMSRDEATQIIHIFSFVNYFMPILGAWVSERFWGRYKTILWISLSYCAGHGVLALSDAFSTVDAKTICLYAGLGLIAFGSGGIKPCVSAFMGDQFGPERRHLLPRAYAAFYWSINLGSTAAFLTIPYIRKEWGYSWAFGVPGVAMAFATFVFWLGTKHYVMVPPASKTKSAGFFRVFFFALANRKNRQTGQKFWDPARERFTDKEVDAASSVGPILMIFALAPVFWALFDQTFSTWVLQGEMMQEYDIPLAQLGWIGSGLAVLFSVLAFPAARDSLRNLNRTGDSARRTPFGLILFAGLVLLAITGVVLSLTKFRGSDFRYAIGPEEMLSANPIFVMIFVPIMSLVVYPLMGRFATPLKRMSTGMFLAAGSFVIVAWLQTRLDGGEQLSILWQILPYVVLTIAEVLFSTTGLEFAFREAAPSMKSIIMGFWTLTVAFGNLLVTFVTEIAAYVLGDGANGHDVAVSPQMFLFYAGLTFVVAIAFSVICSFYRYRDDEAARGH